MRHLLTAILFLLPAASFAQPAAGNCPGFDGENDGAAIECIMNAINAGLPEGCSPIDFKALGKRIKDTKHIGLLGKIKLGLRAKGLMGKAREYDASPSEARLAKLKSDYDKLFGDFVKKLDGKDPALVQELNCVRGSGFDVLLLNAHRENEKKRREENGTSSPDSTVSVVPDSSVTIAPDSTVTESP